MTPEIIATFLEEKLPPSHADLTTPTTDLSAAGEAPRVEKPQILAELVIEEVSIDGMCGVY